MPKTDDVKPGDFQKLINESKGTEAELVVRPLPSGLCSRLILRRMQAILDWHRHVIRILHRLSGGILI